MGGVTAWRWCAEWYSATGNGGNEGGSDEARERADTGQGVVRGEGEEGESSGRVCGAGEEEGEEGERGAG